MLVVAACTTTLPGAPLAIDTAGLLLPGGCGGVEIPPFRIQRDGDTLRFVDADTAAVLHIVWPNGFAARLENGAATLYASDGTVVGVENEIVRDIGACERPDGSLLMDSIGDRIYR